MKIEPNSAPAFLRASILVACATVASVTWSACGSAPPPAPDPILVAPALQTQTEHRLGTILAGAAVPGEAEAADLTDLLGIRCTIRFLEHAPLTELDAVASRTRLVAARGGYEPILPVPILARRARVATGADARAFLDALERGSFGRTALVDELDGALPIGGTVAFRARSPLHESGQPKLASPEVAVLASRTDTADVQFALTSEGLAPIERDDDLTSPGMDEPVEASLDIPDVSQRQILVLDDPGEQDGNPLVVLFRSPFSVAEVTGLAADASPGFVAILELSSVVDDAVRANCRADLDSPPPAFEFGGLDAVEAQRIAVHSAEQALALAPDQQRPAIVFLAHATGAVVAESLALVADDATLQALAEAIVTPDPPPADAVDTTPPSESAPDNVERERVELGWRFERAAFLLLAQACEDDQHSALAGLLLRHTGEAGRDPAAIRSMASRAADAAAMQLALLGENRVALEDRNPGARVRAFDWLSARGAVPAGFDPLADRAARKAALAQAEADAAQAEAEATDAAADRPTADSEPRTPR